MDPKHLLAQIENLPSLKRMEAEDFIEFLATQHASVRQIPPLTFSWAGGLADLKEQFTFRDLKKQALDWMGHAS
ncbi:MAG: DUF2281 domain-containing protein [Candidatus Kapaibacterium sp.]